MAGTHAASALPNATPGACMYSAPMHPWVDAIVAAQTDHVTWIPTPPAADGSRSRPSCDNRLPGRLLPREDQSAPPRRLRSSRSHAAFAWRPRRPHRRDDRAGGYCRCRAGLCGLPRSRRGGWGRRSVSALGWPARGLSASRARVVSRRRSHESGDDAHGKGADRRGHRCRSGVLQRQERAVPVAARMQRPACSSAGRRW